jgi:hypothetical protein
MDIWMDIQSTLIEEDAQPENIARIFLLSFTLWFTYST